MEIIHFSHEHPLVLHRTEHESETCNLCLQTIHYIAFACSDCGFLLHKECAKLPREMEHHPLHPEHPLVLVPNHPDSPKPFKCSACEKTRSGFVFTCSKCEYSLDVSCFLRTQPVPGLPSRQKVRKIHHFSHQHSLLPRYVGENDSTGRSCRGCEMPLSGTTYYCPECPEFSLHKSCSQLPQQIQHPFHPLHPLSLLTKSPYPSGSLYCDACKKTIRNGFVYHCAICKFDLDLGCASRVPSLRHEKHREHPLDFFEDIGAGIGGVVVACNICGKKCQEHIYRCIACNFDAHSTCLQFPSTVKHKNHKHSLSLKESVAKGDLGWFPCEVCKKRITPKHRVYYCEDCSYGIHIECLDSEELQHHPASDPNLAKILEDIAKVRAKADALTAELKRELEALSTKLQSLLGK